MRRLISTVWIALTFILLLSSCTDKLDQAIIDGYRIAFKSDENKVRLSEDDFNNICIWFQTYADEKKDSNYNDQEWRWDYIWDVLSEEFRDENIERVDETQWLGAQPVLPLTIDVYLDNTSSMKGYIMHSHEDDPTFVNVFHAIDDYKYNCDRGKRVIISDTIRSYYTQRNKEKNMDELVYLSWEGEKGLKDQLDHFKHMTSFTDSYQLDNFLNHIVKNMIADTTHCHLTFFVTDGIPSGNNREVTRGGTWNIDHAPELKNRIRKTSEALANNNGGISVYQFEGDFYAEDIYDCRYWYHDNGSQLITPIDKLKRPFYVIVLGDAEATEDFEKQVETGLNLFKPVNQVHFRKATVDFDTKVIAGEKKAEFDTKTDTYSFIGINEQKLNVNIQIPLKALPSFFDNSAITVKVDEKNFKTVTRSKDENELEIGPISLEKRTEKDISITIRNISPNWTDSITVRNDITEGCQGGTFNFFVLIDGLREGFYGTDNVLYETKLSIKRQD